MVPKQDSSTKTAENQQEIQDNGCSYKVTSCTKYITDTLEDFFEAFGTFVAQRPWKTIAASLLLCLICSAGNILFKENNDTEAAWTPEGSAAIEQNKWIKENFPKDTRYETVIISTENELNVLTPATIIYLFELHQRTLMLNNSLGNTYNDLCLKYVSILEPGAARCATSSLLNLWSYNETVIRSLSDQDILEAVTEALAKSSELSPIDQIDQLLGGLQFNETSGQVIKAKALMNVWLLKQNGSKTGEGKIVDEAAMDWEIQFVEEIIINGQDGCPFNFDGFAERSYDDGVEASVNSNFTVMFGGFSLIFFYVCVSLGKWNAVEQRVVLALMGILVIGMSLGSAFGFCFFTGLTLGDLHQSIPFLLLGIGVDDIYVIVQALNNLTEEEKLLPLHGRIGKAMRHAGVAITVTSITDMAAFFIGSSSSMPVMRGFCLFAAMGVFFLYIFAITFFVGCLTIDERRIDAKKVCNFSCIPSKSKDWTPSLSTDPGKFFFGKILSPFLSDTRVKVLVIVVTLVCLGFGIYGTLNIRLDYDPIWFMDQKSYQTNYLKRMREDFPEQGERVEVYIGDIPFWNHRAELLQVEKVLNSSKYINQESIQFWHTHFHDDCCGSADKVKTYCLDMMDFEGELSCSDELSFKRRLLLFLQENQYYIPDFRFNVTLEDMTDDQMYDLYEKGSFQIIATRAKFQHNRMSNTTTRIKAMNQVKDGLAKIIFQSQHVNSMDSPIAYSYMYMQWEANETISSELIRNLGLTFATILAVSLILIMNIQICLMVFISVVFSVTNVCGYAHFMGLTIEMVTSISLILSVGLALDYAAHFGVLFASLKTGSRQEKMKKSLEEIGSAVLNGGISTFLAFFLLAFSDAYAFNTFFKMFATLVLFGLYHGLIFLPVLLSLIGPSSEPILPSKKVVPI